MNRTNHYITSFCRIYAYRINIFDIPNRLQRSHLLFCTLIYRANIHSMRSSVLTVSYTLSRYDDISYREGTNKSGRERNIQLTKNAPLVVRLTFIDAPYKCLPYSNVTVIRITKHCGDSLRTCVQI